MKISYLLIFFLFILLSSCGNSTINIDRSYDDDTDSKVLRKYCYKCHAPSVHYLEGPSLETIYHKYKTKGKKLNRYLVKEFLKKEKKGHEYHKDTLTKEEIKSIILAIEHKF